MNNIIKLYFIDGCKDCMRIKQLLYDAAEVYKYTIELINVDHDPLITAAVFIEIKKLGCTPQMFPFFTICTPTGKFIESFEAVTLQEDDIYIILKKYEYRQF
jgi:thiol-disulfide isomerase/thioredoxin